jgi:hypothetical protein
MTRKITRDGLTELLATGKPVQFVETLRAEHFAQAICPAPSTSTSRRSRSARPRRFPTRTR